MCGSACYKAKAGCLVACTSDVAYFCETAASLHNLRRQYYSRKHAYASGQLAEGYTAGAVQL